MTHLTAFLSAGIVGLLLIASVIEAQNQDCPATTKGRRTYSYSPKIGRTSDVLVSCNARQAAYDCIRPLAQTYDPQDDFVDFDKFVTKYVECVFNDRSYSQRMNLSYIDPRLPGFYLQMSMRNITYGEAAKMQRSFPEVLLVKKFHNEQADDYVKSEVMQSVERTQTTSNTVSKGFSTSGSVEAGIKTPFVEASVKAEVNFDLDNSRTQTETHTRTLSLTDTIIVPPKSTVKLIWSISQSEMDVPWTGELMVSGWIPIKFPSDREYSYIPVGHMASFFEEYFESSSSTSMIYHTKGNFRGVTAVDSHIDTVQMRLHEDRACPKQ